jgi:hypothetical protein
MIYHDDFGHLANYEVDLNKQINNFETLAQNFSYWEYAKFTNEYLDILTQVGRLGMNLIDFYLLGQYIKNNNVKKITELGCGSTSAFLDKLGIYRESFSLFQAGGFENLNFVKCDIYESADIINKSCENADLLLIDSQHSNQMAEFYHKNILSRHKLPIFIHDFMDNGQPTYSEQIYWIENLLDKEYKIFAATNSLYPEKPTFLLSGIFMPCAAVLEPI